MHERAGLKCARTGKVEAGSISQINPEVLMLGFILYLVIVGLVAGFIARLLVPGRDPLSIGGTIVLGIVGSFIGGLLGYLLFGVDFDEGAIQASGIIGSIVGAVIALLVYRRVNQGRTARA
jgi:uncharacterized membrane protein YeaQ/YmgE (transglycosylase-associated protein family)